MKIKMKKLLSVILCVTLIFNMFSVVLAAKPSLDQTTEPLVDVIIDYSSGVKNNDGSSKYLSQFKSGISTWEGYKSGIIRADSASVIQDVKIYDENVSGKHAGRTSPDSKAIVFNDFKMKDLSDEQKQNVATHELRHALGLDHNTSKTDMMFPNVTTVASLSENDKASYDAACAAF